MTINARQRIIEQLTRSFEVWGQSFEAFGQSMERLIPVFAELGAACVKIEETTALPQPKALPEPKALPVQRVVVGRYGRCITR